MPDTPNLVDPDWRPTFVDYLYVSLTNVMAFSPTDTMPWRAGPRAMMDRAGDGRGDHRRTRNRKGGERFGLTVQPENRSTFAVMGIADHRTDTGRTDRISHRVRRALDSRWPTPILGDTLADEVVGKIDYDFAGLGVQTSVVCQTALRAKMLDDRVRAFRRTSIPTPSSSTSAPGSTAASIASIRRRRSTGTASTCPGIIALRDEVLPANPHSHSVPVSLADQHWPDAIPADRPTMLSPTGCSPSCPSR